MNIFEHLCTIFEDEITRKKEFQNKKTLKKNDKKKDKDKKNFFDMGFSFNIYI